MVAQAGLSRIERFPRHRESRQQWDDLQRHCCLTSFIVMTGKGLGLL